MAGLKRHLENGDAGRDEHAQPSRKRRIEYTGADAELAKIYNDLADEVEAVRSKAASDLIRVLWTKSPERIQRLDAAIERLIKGLCSGRKAARLGFSVVLPEVLRLRFGLVPEDESKTIDISALVNNVITWTHADTSASGPEKRDHLHGRRFAAQAILQSDVGLDKKLTNDSWRYFLDQLFKLANQKQWVRRDCGAMLHNYLLTPRGSTLSNDRVKAIVDALVDCKLAKTPEGVGLWTAIAKQFDQVSFPKDVWHHNDPLSSKERPMLGKALLENAQVDDDEVKKGGYRQSTPSFAWSVVLDNLYERKGGKDFVKFWEEVAAGSMFSSTASTERKSLGLQVFSIAVTTAPSERLMDVFHPSILRCLIDQRSNKDRYLFEASKTALAKVVERTKQDSTAAAVAVRALLIQGIAQLDQIIKLKTIESIITTADASSLEEITNVVHTLILDPRTKETAQAETRRRVLADLLLTMVRLRKDLSTEETKSTEKFKSPNGWSESVLRALANTAYLDPSVTTELAPSTRLVFQSRLMSCLNEFLHSGLEHGVWAPVLVVQQLTEAEIAKSGSIKKSLSAAKKNLDKAVKSKDRAFALLLSLSMIQVYNEEPDAVGVLDDAVACYQSKGDNVDSSVTLVELLLSFVSKPSALFRKLAEQVFSAFASEMTSDSLQSLLDILEQKESLSGQQELFDQNDDDEKMGDDEDDEDSEVEVEDVEDASDLELDNGNIVGGTSTSDSDSDDDDESSDTDSSSSGGSEDAIDEDEEAVFDRKLAEALGTNGMDGDSDSDGSDMDDEQMMALEPHLNNIFKERQKQTTKTQDNKTAKQTIVNFKNRVLDLLSIYVKHQPASNILALDLLLPLTVLTRTTTSKPTADKALNVLKTYFESSSKQKLLPSLSTPQQVKACTALLHALHAELLLDPSGAKIHAAAGSRASLFVSKVLCAHDSQAVESVVDAYAGLLKEWFRKPKTGLPQVVFTEWMSWSVELRRKMREG